MTFQWPLMLLGLMALPVLAAAYVWALRRPVQAPVAHTQLALLAQAVARSSPWRRHVPAALAALALIAPALPSRDTAGCRRDACARPPRSPSAPASRRAPPPAARRW